MVRLELFLLGSPHVKRDGRSAKVKRRKAAALLAYLAVAGSGSEGGYYTRDTLATLFWPESDQAHARTALRQAISVLRQTLGEEWLEIDQESLALKRNTGFWLDVDHFHSRLAECRTHGHSKDAVCPACLAPLAEAATLYRDDFLAGFTLHDCLDFDEWQRIQGEKLHRELNGVLEQLARGYSAKGEFETAIGYARRWLSLNPLHEPAHRCLMRLCAQAGQRATALQQYEECIQVLERELGVPAHEETTRLYQAIKENREVQPIGSTVPAPFVCPHNLPLQPTPFIGREDELAQINQLLATPNCRLLTVIGLGGIGKTRLALETALRAVNGQIETGFRDGVYFIPLTLTSSVDFLVSTIATALGFSFRGRADPKKQLLDYLRGKEMLLLMDNFEHLIAGAGLMAEILSNVSGIKLLITSRERLNLRWEWPLEIEGLTYPRNGQPVPLRDYSAIQLFLQSARRACSTFLLPEEEEPFVIRICQSLEGVPLAIELAAAWVELLPCQEISQQIEHNLDLLGTTLRDVPARHRSMRAAFDHSWNLLADVHYRTLFAKGI